MVNTEDGTRARVKISYNLIRTHQEKKQNRKSEDKSRAEEQKAGERGNQTKLHEKEERNAVRDYNSD